MFEWVLKNVKRLLSFYVQAKDLSVWSSVGRSPLINILRITKH